MCGLDLTKRLVNLSTATQEEHKKYVARHGKISEEKFQLIFTKGATFGMDEAREMVDEQLGVSKTLDRLEQIKRDYALWATVLLVVGGLVGFILRGLL